MIKIYRCVKSNLLSQGFGEANTKPSLLYIYESLGLLGHDGFDWAVKCQNNFVKTGGQCENVYCDLVDGATITYIQKDVKNGYGIVAIDKEGDKHLWWHFDSISPALKVGDRIESGDLLGVGGNTGNSTGAHVHRAYYRYDEDPNNGYHGATDMTPYMKNIFILDELKNMQEQVGLLQQLVNLLKLLLNFK